MRGWGALAKWAPFFDDAGANPVPWAPGGGGGGGGPQLLLPGVVSSVAPPVLRAIRKAGLAGNNTIYTVPAATVAFVLPGVPGIAGDLLTINQVGMGSFAFANPTAGVITFGDTHLVPDGGVADDTNLINTGANGVGAGNSGNLSFGISILNPGESLIQNEDVDGAVYRMAVLEVPIADTKAKGIRSASAQSFSYFAPVNGAIVLGAIQWANAPPSGVNQDLAVFAIPAGQAADVTTAIVNSFNIGALGGSGFSFLSGLNGPAALGGGDELRMVATAAGVNTFIDVMEI